MNSSRPPGGGGQDPSTVTAAVQHGEMQRGHRVPKTSIRATCDLSASCHAAPVTIEGSPPTPPDKHQPSITRVLLLGALTAAACMSCLPPPLHSSGVMAQALVKVRTLSRSRLCKLSALNLPASTAQSIRWRLPCHVCAYAVRSLCSVPHLTSAVGVCCCCRQLPMRISSACWARPRPLMNWRAPSPHSLSA